MLINENSRAEPKKRVRTQTFENLLAQGTFELTRSWISFVPDATRSEARKTSRDDSAAISRLCAQTHRWATAELTELHGRRYLLRDTALELFFASSPPVFLNFPPPQPGAKEDDGEAGEVSEGRRAGVGGILFPALGTMRSTPVSDVGDVYKAVLALKSQRLHKLSVACVCVFARLINCACVTFSARV